MRTAEFLFDFGSPNAFLAHSVIPAIEQRTGARFEYVPVLLGGIFKLTNNRSPVESLRDVRNKLEYEQLEMDRFIQRHRIEGFRINPHFPINTLTLMRGAVAAHATGVFERYVDEMFRHMWVNAKKLDDPQVLRATLDESGFDGERLLAMTQEPSVKETLQRNTIQAVERGAFGAPTFFVGGGIYFGKDRLRDIEEVLLALPR